MANKVKSEIQQSTIARGRDLASGDIFYVVKSDSQANTWYEVRWNDGAYGWRCNCPATQPCKHCRAVNQVLQARRLALVLSQPKPTPVEPTEASERMMAAPLNGNRSFSLLK